MHCAEGRIDGDWVLKGVDMRIHNNNKNNKGHLCGTAKARCTVQREEVMGGWVLKGLDMRLCSNNNNKGLFSGALSPS